MPDRNVLERIGYMTQATALYTDLSAEENASFFAAVHGGGDVEAALRFVDLWERRASVTSTLSGGMRTRLSLACALVHRPDLLLLDEPTVGVDPQLRAQLWDGLREMAAGGTTIIVSSHVMDEAERADRLGLMLDGRILAEGTVADLLALAGTDRAGGRVPASLRRRTDGPMSLRRTFAITGRLMRQFRHDRRTLAILFVTPLLVLALFAALFRTDAPVPTVGVVAGDGSLPGGDRRGADRVGRGGRVAHRQPRRRASSGSATGRSTR